MQAYSIAALVGLAVSIFVMAMAANHNEAPAKTVGGDFPAFYGAAVIAADGDWEELYDFDRQVAVQRELQEKEGSARYFAYPPQVALAHAPLAAFDYGWAYLIYTAAMFMFLVATVWLAQPLLPWLRGRTWPAVAIALSFWPMLRAVTGGSNTAITLFIIVAAWRLIEDDRLVAAGLVLSLLLAKPQLAVPLIGLMLVIGLYRVVAGAVAGSVAFYLSGVPLVGWSWPQEWWDTATTFGRIDSEVNGFSSVSWLGFLENALGVGDPFAVTMGWLLAGLTTIGLIGLWHRHGRGRLPALLAIAMPGILLLSPHALSHDTAIVLLTLAVLHNANRLPRELIAIVWLLGLSQAWIDPIGFSPGFFLLLLLGWWTVTRLGLLPGRPTQEPGQVTSWVSAR
jgi:hypothetical protein